MDARLRRRVVDRAKQDYDLTVKLGYVPEPRSSYPPLDRKLRRALRYYRRYYRQKTLT